MNVVCLDTQILQWGVMKKESKTQNSQKLIDRATYFIDWLDQQSVSIILPSFVVGELLVTVPEREHPRVLNLLDEDWMIVDYDLRAAQQFAVMRYNQALKQIMNDIRQGNPYATRRQLIADIMIIATAIVNGASKIYSHDSDFINLASGYIIAENFMDMEIQSNFLDQIPDDDE